MLTAPCVLKCIEKQKSVCFFFQLEKRQILPTSSAAMSAADEATMDRHRKLNLFIMDR
jgi:hypothetical protein